MASPTTLDVSVDPAGASSQLQPLLTAASPAKGPLRIGIVAVHGVMPQIRYGFQDEVATNLCRALNERKGAPGPWKMTVVLPQNGSADAQDVPTISRVHHLDEPDPAAPMSDYFDVHEAYWSPLDKGKTNIASVLQWLVATIFAPFSAFARYREWPPKVGWDIGYILAGLLVAVGSLLAAGLWAAKLLKYFLKFTCNLNKSTVAFVDCSKAPVSLWTQILTDLKHFWPALGSAFQTLFGMLAILLSPLTLVKTLTPTVIVLLVCAAVDSFLIWQAVRASIFLLMHAGELKRRDTVQFGSRMIAIGVLLLIATPLAVVASKWPIAPQRPPLGPTVLWTVAAVATFDLGRTLLTKFIVNFFGDVQIYTTRDQNSDFYALHDAILDKVVAVLLNVATKHPAGTPYDRVHVLAHSLGSSIAMDALLRLYNVQATSGVLSPTITPGDWQRIRAFVTFGTALEKTKYFFNAWNATPSQQWEQWSGAIYGSVFTAEGSALNAPSNAGFGVFWHNNWFFSDFVSDQICSYRSFLLPDDHLSTLDSHKTNIRKKSPGQRFVGRIVGANRWTFGPIQHVQTHTWYLEGNWFWGTSRPISTARWRKTLPEQTTSLGVLDVLTAGMPSFAHLNPLTGEAPATPSRAEAISAARSGRFRSSEII
jgi:hypothetical protein